MQITHKEARKFIQFDSDEALGAQERAILSAHLQNCTECRAYAEDIKEVEGILLPLMKRHWDIRPVPLPIGALISSGRSKLRQRILLTTRIAVSGMVFAAFALAVWQLSLPGQRPGTPAPINVLPVPTPSMQSTSTRIILQDCDQILYKVREGDTLQHIAFQSSVPKEEIMRANSLDTEAINTGMELVIPLCNFTPTVIAKPTTLTTTYTPVTESHSSTPDG
jgi:LysM repeat protein